jgi:hypothetical protein
LNFFVIPEHSQLTRHVVEIDVPVGDEALRTDHTKLTEILSTLSGPHSLESDAQNPHPAIDPFDDRIGGHQIFGRALSSIQICPHDDFSRSDDSHFAGSLWLTVAG